MKTFLTCSAFVVLGLAARADDRTATTDSAPAEASAIVAPVDAAGGLATPAPLMMPPQLPHYYGRGEGPSFGCGGNCGANGGCSSCDGTGFGSCARPRSYHLHLWDDYCYETTRCPNCGCGLGTVYHKCWCEREGCGTCGCGSCDCGGCGCCGHLPGFSSACCSQGCALPSISLPRISLPCCAKTTCAKATCTTSSCASGGCAARASDEPAMEPSAAPAKKPGVPVPPPPPTAEKLKAPTPVDPAPKKESPKEKTSRVAPEPSSASLLDRLFPWRTRSTR